MSSADRLDKIESRLDHTSYHRHKGDVSALVAALRAVLDLADRWAAAQLGTGERDVIAAQACYDRADQIEEAHG